MIIQHSLDLICTTNAPINRLKTTPVVHRHIAQYQKLNSSLSIPLRPLSISFGPSYDAPSGSARWPTRGCVFVHRYTPVSFISVDTVNILSNTSRSRSLSPREDANSFPFSAIIRHIIAHFSFVKVGFPASIHWSIG